MAKQFLLINGSTGTLFFKYAQFQSLYLMVTIYLYFRNFEAFLLVQKVSVNKVTELRNMRWYDSNADLKMNIKAIGRRLLPKYIYKSVLNNWLKSLF
jgi:hypothetical protein